MNIELYEAIKSDDREKAARMIAEVIPMADELVTKTYLREEFERFESRLDSKWEPRFDAIERRFDRAFRWAVVFVAPLWTAALAALVRVVVVGA